MRNILAVFGKEFRSYFSSPTAYVIFTVFLVLTGYFFYALLSQFMVMSLRAMQYAQAYGQNMPLNVNDMLVRPLFANMSIVILFVLPMMTMRLFAEEKKMGTIELLITSPITNIQIILGKYLASVAVLAIMISLTFVHQLVLIIYGNPEVMPILASYLGMLLLGSSFLAFGLLISSFTDNQVVAGFTSFGVFMFLWVIGWAEGFAGPLLGKLVAFISVTNHFNDFGKGVIDTGHIVFYLSCIVLGLFLTERTLESWKWRQ